jgi:hypothetical protein
MASSESGIDWFAFERKDAEDTLVHAAQRFAPDKTFQRFDPESEFAKC